MMFLAARLVARAVTPCMGWAPYLASPPPQPLRLASDNRTMRFLVRLGWCLPALLITECLGDAPPFNERPEAGALAETWPADGSQGVAQNLRVLAVRFPERAALQEPLRLLDEVTGEAIPLQSLGGECASIGWPTGICAIAAPKSALNARTSYRVVFKGTAEDGLSLEGQSLFRTGIGRDTLPPRLEPLECALDEAALSVGCALMGDVYGTLRVRSNEPVRLWLKAGDAACSAIAPRETASLLLRGLAPATRVKAKLQIADAADNLLEQDFLLQTYAELPKLSISKILANPIGKEPDQEFIEIHNFGSTPMELQGFQVSDNVSRIGDIFPHSMILSANGRALVVAEGFDAQSVVDSAIPSGIPLVRVQGPLGTGGLSNSGEVILLRDAQGRRLSAAPALPSPQAGACWFRTGQDPRSDSPEQFSYEPLWDCDPGRPVAPDND